MAFRLQNWCRASASANEPLYTLADASIVGCFREYNYYTSDSQATVSASSYFDDVAYDITSGDYVHVYSSADGSKVSYRLTNSSGVISSAIVDGSYIVSATLSLTAAQFIAGYATPIVALAAPGANRMYTNVRAAFFMTYGSAQFANGGAIGFQYGSSANLAGTKVTGTLAAASLNALVASSAWTLIPAAVAPVAIATPVNAGIYLSNDTAAFTGGTAATFVVQVSANVVSSV